MSDSTRLGVVGAGAIAQLAHLPVLAKMRCVQLVGVGNNYRFRTDVQALARFIHGGELGKVTGIRAGAYQFKRPAEGWRLRRPESGGGAFFDHGAPLLDLALWLAELPEAERVTASME